MPFELFIAGRYLRAKRKQTFISLISFLSVAGVALGVMALIVVLAVMAGAETDFRKRILGVEAHVLLSRHGEPFDNYAAAVDTLKAQPGVTAAAPFVSGKVILRSPYGMAGAFLRGIDPGAKRTPVQGVSREALQTMLARPVAENGGGRRQLAGVILGASLAAELGVSEGDVLQVMSPKFMLSPVGLTPKVRRFAVRGTFSSGLYQYDSTVCYLRLEDAARLMGLGDAVSGVGIWLSDVYGAQGFAKKVQQQFGYPYLTKNWMDLNGELFSALKLEKTAMFIILTLIILVAAFNIASSLIMMVMDKTRDIAILKAMGATRRTIRRIFVLQGMIIGSIGTGIGIVLGTVLCLVLERYPFIRLPEAYPFATLPVELAWLDVLLVAVSALLICFLSTLYPARQASLLDPVEGIRYG